MLASKTIGFELVKKEDTYVRVPIENFVTTLGINNRQLLQALAEIKATYPQYQLLLDLRGAELSITGDLLRLKKGLKEEFNYALLINPESAIHFTLKSVNALDMFNVIFPDNLQ